MKKFRKIAAVPDGGFNGIRSRDWMQQWPNVFRRKL